LIQADPDVASLSAMARRRIWQAEAGTPGAGARKSGRAGSDLRLLVPPGTVVLDAESGLPLADLAAAGQEFVAARGGGGGRGNVHFATPTHRAPHLAEQGRKGEERKLVLDLKLIADAALVGPPNAGKSSLLAAMSAARPKVGAYPFTTLTPELGVASDSAGGRVVVADVPGLIEGAAQGAGLGLAFLRHVERTRVLVFVVDAGSPDPWGTLEAVRLELAGYSADLLSRPSLVVFNKVDLEAGRLLRARNRRRGVIFCSALTGEGVPEVVQAISAAVATSRAAAASAEPAPIQLPRRGRKRGQAPVVTAHSWGFSVAGPRIEGLVEATDFDSAHSLERFQVLLDRIGVSAALAEAGAEPGDTVRIGDLEFEYQP
jgi:GTP-binding protein